MKTKLLKEFRKNNSIYYMTSIEASCNDVIKDINPDVPCYVIYGENDGLWFRDTREKAYDRLLVRFKSAYNDKYKNRAYNSGDKKGFIKIF